MLSLICLLAVPFVVSGQFTWGACNAMRDQQWNAANLKCIGEHHLWLGNCWRDNIDSTKRNACFTVANSANSVCHQSKDRTNELWHAACDVLNGRNKKEVFDMLALLIPNINEQEKAGTPFMADEAILGIAEAYIKADASAITSGIMTKVASALKSKGLSLSELLATAVDDDYDATQEYNKYVEMTGLELETYDKNNQDYELYYNYNDDYDYYSDYSDYNDYYGYMFEQDDEQTTLTCPQIRDKAETICRAIVYPAMNTIWSGVCTTTGSTSCTASKDGALQIVSRVCSIQYFIFNIVCYSIVGDVNGILTSVTDLVNQFTGGNLIVNNILNAVTVGVTQTIQSGEIVKGTLTTIANALDAGSVPLAGDILNFIAGFF